MQDSPRPEPRAHSCKSEWPGRLTGKKKNASTPKPANTQETPLGSGRLVHSKVAAQGPVLICRGQWKFLV